jgi:hypothetical protein
MARIHESDTPQARGAGVTASGLSYLAHMNADEIEWGSTSRE